MIQAKFDTALASADAEVVVATYGSRAYKRNLDVGSHKPPMVRAFLPFLAWLGETVSPQPFARIPCQKTLSRLYKILLTIYNFCGTWYRLSHELCLVLVSPRFGLLTRLGRFPPRWSSLAETARAKAPGAMSAVAANTWNWEEQKSDMLCQVMWGVLSEWQNAFFWCEVPDPPTSGLGSSLTSCVLFRCCLKFQVLLKDEKSI